MKRILTSILAALLVILISIGCGRDDDKIAKTFVLVHGAWQAPYVWKQVMQGLEFYGHRVIAVELPGHGSDTTSPQTLSIEVYSKKVIEAANSVQGKVILVGHSLGGMVITAAVEKNPEKFEKLIYVGAFVPANGQSLLDLALQDNQSHLGASLVPSPDQLTLGVKQDSIIPVFCHDAPMVLQQEVLSKFRVEPAIPFTNKATITNNGFGKADKYYIHTMQDRAIGINLQRNMITAAGITKKDSINTSHSPFLSRPVELVSILLKMAN